MYLHLCSHSSLFQKTLQMIIQKLHTFTPHIEFLMLHQQTILSRQPQIAPLVINGAK